MSLRLCTDGSARWVQRALRQPRSQVCKEAGPFLPGVAVPVQASSTATSMAAAMDMQPARQQLAAIANLDRSLGSTTSSTGYSEAGRSTSGSVRSPEITTISTSRRGSRTSTRSKAALLSNGWWHTPDLEEVVGTGYQLHGMEADFTSLSDRGCVHR